MDILKLVQTLKKVTEWTTLKFSSDVNTVTRV